ncbi:hypothetical protein ACFSCW_05320 [Sphingomonas tabacisoli]|uniref:Lipocalin-like domain-containing protein n=1 Tax=Sphingomonas tabacisoli TaxID=2249466 RepID=A0ABW4HZZ2_9SPHN
MNGRANLAFALAGLAILFPQSASAAAPDAKLWNGTWHLNAAKSKFASSAKEQSETRTFDIAGNKVTMKSSSKDSSGKAMNFSYSAAYDGKWYPMVGNPNADHISLTAVSGREIRSKAQLHGKPSTETTAMVSADGKHLTMRRKMLRLPGAPTDVLEFDR